MVRDVVPIEAFTPTPYIFCIRILYTVLTLYSWIPDGWSDSILIEIFVPFYCRIHFCDTSLPAPVLLF